MPLTPAIWRSEFTVNTTTAMTQDRPDIIQLADGNIMISWHSDADTGAGSPAGFDIIGQIFDPFGTPIGSEFLVNTSRNMDTELNGTLAATVQGGFLAAYVDLAAGALDPYQIYLEQKDASGAQISGVSVSLSDEISLDPQVVVSSPTSALVVWKQSSEAFDADLVNYRMYNPTTGVLAPEPSPSFIFGNGLGNGALSGLTATTLNSGNYVVAAASHFDSGDDEIWFRIVSSSGTPLSFVRVAETRDNIDSEREPSVTALTSGGFVLGWHSTDSNDTDTYFQTFTSGGLAVGAAVAVNGASTSDNRFGTEVVALSDGGFLVLYDDNGLLNDLSGQRFSAAGVPVGNAFTVDSDGGNQMSAVLLADGRVAVTWVQDEIKMAIFDTRDAPNTATGVPGVQAGTIGDDVFTAAATADVVNSWDGNDTVTEAGIGSVAHHDLGAGNDMMIVTSTIGSDGFDGGAGNDVIDWRSSGQVGGSYDMAAGTASANGQTEIMAGFETLLGNNTTETIIGSDGDNRITANGGRDNVQGGEGGDTISGGEGNDTLRGQAGADQLLGGNGNDRIDGGSENDTINGNAGDDTINGGDGQDLLSGSDGNDTINGGKGNDTIKGFADNDSLRGENGTDVISGGFGADTIDGGTGDDNIDGGDGDDSINGGTDNDEIFGRQRNDTIFGDDGMDTLNGNDGNDVVDGGNGADTILGGSGNDTLMGGTNNDTLRGELGLDSIDGGTGDDVISGQQNSDRLNGDDGDDRISGGTGNDTINGGIGNDTLQGNQNDDSILGSWGDDQITGGGGFDIMRGEAGADVLNGNEGRDTLFGGIDTDTLIGGSGDDMLTGGGDVDTFIFENGFGNDTITDFDAANGEKIDVSGFSGITSFADVLANLSNSSGNALITAGTNSILLEGVATSEIGVGLAYSGDDFIF